MDEKSTDWLRGVFVQYIRMSTDCLHGVIGPVYKEILVCVVIAEELPC